MSCDSINHSRMNFFEFDHRNVRVGDLSVGGIMRGTDGGETHNFGLVVRVQVFLRLLLAGGAVANIALEQNHLCKNTDISC